MPDQSLTVDARFNGPPGSGNGGYVAGLLAAQVARLLPAYRPGDPVQVTLREPPPLAVRLLVAADEGRVVATFGGALVADAEPGGFGSEQVTPVAFDVAIGAEQRYGGLVAHPFPGCFVCGTERRDGDGMGLRPGRVGGPAGAAGVVATTWVPDASLTDADGMVGEPFVWAALDCPGGWASDLTARPMVLGRITARVHARPYAGDRCVVVGRVLRVEGRKTFSASTAYDGDGRALGHAEATWIATG